MLAGLCRCNLYRVVQAYLAARRALDLDPSHTKSRFRLARALLHLRCYGPALEYLHIVVHQVRCAVGFAL